MSSFLIDTMISFVSNGSVVFKIFTNCGTPHLEGAIKAVVDMPRSRWVNDPSSVMTTLVRNGLGCEACLIGAFVPSLDPNPPEGGNNLPFLCLSALHPGDRTSIRRKAEVRFEEPSFNPFSGTNNSIDVRIVSLDDSRLN